MSMFAPSGVAKASIASWPLVGTCVSAFNVSHTIRPRGHSLDGSTSLWVVWKVVQHSKSKPAYWQVHSVSATYQDAAVRLQTVWVAREAVNRGPISGGSSGQVASATPQAAVAAAEHLKPRSRAAGAPAVDVAQILKDR